MDKMTHLTTDDLILFMDRELDQATTASAEQHLLRCVECGGRLRALQDGSAAHHHYHEQVLKAELAVPESSWPRLRERLEPKRRPVWMMWWAAAAIAGTLAVVWNYFPVRTEPSAQGVLEKAEAVSETPKGEILFASSKYRFARAAVLEAGGSEARFPAVQALFVQANYSWTNPLSARSFADWRRHLAEKRDFVTTIREEGGRQFYRVRTRTDSGVLRSASLMLQAASYHPTKASFEFQGEDLIEVSEQESPPVQPLQEVQSVPPKVSETAAGPEDELRVFAALDAIGADAEEPIEVKLDAGHHNVLVTGTGMPLDRRKQIEAALAALPNTIVRFGSGAAATGSGNEIKDAEAKLDGNSPFSQKLRDMAGGARQLQAITDNALDLSNALFAQSHWLLILAQEFPPAVESSLSAPSANTLFALRQRHLGAMSYALRKLREQLRPLVVDDVLITDKAPGAGWQSRSDRLYESTRNLDRLVSRLLAGSYDAPEGELMLKQLPEEISTVETLVLADSR